jgi:hypothetical protein
MPKKSAAEARPSNVLEFPDCLTPASTLKRLSKSLSVIRKAFAAAEAAVSAGAKVFPAAEEARAGEPTSLSFFLLIITANSASQIPHSLCPFFSSIKN